MLSAPLVAGRCGHGVRGPLSSAPSWGPRPAARPIHGRRVVRQTSSKERESYTFSKQYNDDVYFKIRAEAEAPFRSFRLVIFGFLAASALSATLFGLPRVVGTLAGAPNAKSAAEVGLDMAINVGGLGICGYLAKRELDARKKQIARIMREESLGQCQVQLSTGKLVRMEKLRGFSRCIIFAGTPSHVTACLAAAEPNKERLLERGVTLVPLPLFGAEEEGVPPVPEGEDKRWRVTPVRLGEWESWLLEQMRLAGKTEADAAAKGLYIGLRLDGRVRASGVGMPPFERFSLELAPVGGAGAWSGLLDGFDGRVSMFQ